MSVSALVPAKVVPAALLVLIGLALGVVISLARTPSYSSSGELYLTTSLPKRSDANALQQGSAVSLARVDSYASLLISPVVMNAVTEQLNLSMSAHDLARSIDVSVVENTSVIDYSVHSSTPRGAQSLATAVARQATAILPNLETGSQVSFKLVKVGDPELPDGPSPPGASTVIGLGLAAGVAAGMAFLAWASRRPQEEPAARPQT